MEKIKEIDYLRGLATVLVLLIHITSSAIAYPSDSLVYKIIGSFNCSLTFAVPAFLFISALVMTYQVKNKKNINWFVFIGKRLVKVISALVLWSFVYLILNGTLKNITLKSLLNCLLLGNASYHLYFIPLIIQLYLIFPFVWLIAKKLSKIKVSTTLSFVLCLTASFILQYSFTTIFRLNIFKKFIYFATIIFSYLLPISVGIWIGFNYNEIKNFSNKPFILILTMLTIVSGYKYVNLEFINYTYKDSLLFSPIYWTLAILTLTYFLRYVKNLKIINEISKKSFIIYLCHPLFINLLSSRLYVLNFTQNTLINYILNTLLSFFIVLIASYIIASLWYKLKSVKNKS